MPRPFFLLLALSAIACGPASAPEAVTSPATISEGPSVPAGTMDSVAHQVAPPGSRTTPEDSTFYIGTIHSFPETGELYTSMDFLSDVDRVAAYEFLTKATDSVVFEDIEQRRARLPMEVARKYFNLSGLDAISLYKEGRAVGNAGLIRVEYLNGPIESQFIAVFRPFGAATVAHDIDYCTSAAVTRFKTVDKIGVQNIEDEQLTKNLLKTFAPDATHVWNTGHLHILPYASVYSTISIPSRLLLIETIDGQSRILMDLDEDWSILDLTPVHLEINGKPVLLLTIGVNETDFVWSSVAVFDGKQYVFPESNRIRDPSKDASAESDCPFNENYQELTTEWLKESGIDNFTWDTPNNRGLVIQEKDTIFASMGGCEHLGMLAGRTFASDSHAVNDSIYWVGESLKLAKQFGFEFYVEEMRSGRFRFLRNETGSSWFEFGDDDPDDNRYYPGIEVSESKDSKVVTLSEYLN